MSAQTQSFNLDALGWSPHFAEAFEPHAQEGLAPARVAVQHRGSYDLYTEDCEVAAEVAGRLRHAALAAADLPAVGDWVAVRRRPDAGRAVIEAVLPRHTSFTRRAASDGGRLTEEQVVAANVDVVFLVTSLNEELNLRRLERYLATAWESGAEPVIVLSKLDLCADVEPPVVEVEAIAFGVPVHAVSCVTGEGLEGLRQYLDRNRTVALLGSSGVGKSSIVNWLLGEERQEVREIRADGRGRHTTSRRELVPLPSGGLVLDTPGLRQLRLWDVGSGMDGTFSDVSALAERCRFRDCGHESEPGCAVLAALADGSLDSLRLESWRKLERELQWLDVRRDARAVSDARKRRRAFARSMRRPSW